MTSVPQLLARARHYLMSSRRDNQNVLVADWPGGAGPADLSFEYSLEGVSSGSVIGIGLSEFQVFAVNEQQKTATVIRTDTDDNATDPATGDIARINPEFSDLQVFREINGAILDMTGDLWAYTDNVFTYFPAQQSYEIDTSNQNLLEVLEVSYDVPGPNLTWPIIPRSKYAIKRDADLTDFPSGTCITLYAGGYPGRDVRVVFSVPLTQLTDPTAADSPLAPAYEDIACLGAAMRLAGLQEIKRTLTGSQGDTRRANEVPAGAIITATRWLEQEYRRRVVAEKEALARQFPHRRRTR
jgi:hypothetical protein